MYDERDGPKLMRGRANLGEARRRCLAALTCVAAVAALFTPVLAAAQPTPAESTRLFPGARLTRTDRFSVEVVGHGRDVILIAGIGASRETWRLVAEHLRARYRLHLVQIAGFAGEPARSNASGPVLVPTAEAIDRYIIAQHLTPAIVVGHSGAGTIALWLAENRSAHVARAMVIDAPAFLGAEIAGPSATSDSVTPVAEQLASQLGAADPEKFRAISQQAASAMANATSDVDRIVEWRMASVQSVVGRATADDIELDLRPGLAKLRTPVTVVYAYDPRVGVPEGTVRSAFLGQYGANPAIQLLRVEGSRHFVMLDKPAEFERILYTFLGSSL